MWPRILLERRRRHTHIIDIDRLAPQNTADDPDLPRGIVVVADEEDTLGDEGGGEAVDARDVWEIVGDVARYDVLFGEFGWVGDLGVGLQAGEGGSAGGWASDEGDQRRIGGGARIAGFLLVDEDAAFLGDEFGVDDVDVKVGGVGDGGGEALDEGGEEGFGVGHLGDFAFVDEVEGVALGGLLGGGEMLGVQGADLFD